MNDNKPVYIIIREEEKKGEDGYWRTETKVGGKVYKEFKDAVTVANTNQKKEKTILVRYVIKEMALR